MKYNPENKTLTGGNMAKKVGYKKGTMCTEPEKIADIITGGGQIEV